MIEVMEETHKGEFPMPETSQPSSPAGAEWDEETVGKKYPALAQWVNSSVDITPPQAPPSPPKRPLSFWQRLLGKK